jgi:hypothetical protein
VEALLVRKWSGRKFMNGGDLKRQKSRKIGEGIEESSK